MAKLIKSKQRVKDFGEVFTPIWVVNEMLDELEKESDFYNRVAHEAWQFEANEMGDTDIYNLLTEEN